MLAADRYHGGVDSYTTLLDAQAKGQLSAFTRMREQDRVRGVGLDGAASAAGAGSCAGGALNGRCPGGGAAGSGAAGGAVSSGASVSRP